MLKREYKAKKVRIRYVCDNIGDEFLKSMVTRMVDEIVETTKRN